jgi:hypothetical protein
VVSGHNFGCRFGRPVERVSMRVLCRDMGHQLFSQMIQVVIGVWGVVARLDAPDEGFR